MREKYGRICSQCGKLYKYTKVPNYCDYCGHQLVYKYYDKMGLTVYEPNAVPVSYHRTWWGKKIITPFENWAKDFPENKV